MDTDSLRTLQLVARHGSFAAAARILDVDPSSVSRVVAGAEAQLALRLFQRSTRNLQLTEAGEIYLARIGPLLDDLDLAREDAVALAGTQPKGRVRLSASVAFGQEMLVPLLPKIHATLPDIELELSLSDQNVDLVATQVDLAIRLAPAPKGDLISTRLRSTRYRVVAAPAYLSRHGAPAQPQDLTGHACLRMTLPDYRTEWHFRGESTGTVGVTGHVLISNALALRAAARRGLGPALLADWMTDQDIATGQLVDLFPKHEVTATTFETAAWLLYPSRDYLPAKVRGVIDVLRDGLRQR